MLNKLFTKTEPPAPPAREPSAPVRSADVVRQELLMATDSVQPLASRLQTAQAELSDRQQNYDFLLSDYALGRSFIEPDRSAVEAAVSKISALKRIGIQHDQTIRALTTELAAAQLEEAGAQSSERLEPLLALAVAKQAEFEQAVIAAKQAELDLFEILFSERSGLRQRFEGDETAARARKTLYTVTNAVLDAAQKNSFRLHRNYATFGEENLSQEYISAYYAAARK